MFVPVTGGGHTSTEVLTWLNEVFIAPTATFKPQSSRVKNAYGMSEFPGISVNGEISSGIDLELVPVPEVDVLDREGRVLMKRGERYDPSLVITSSSPSSSSPSSSSSSSPTRMRCRRGEIRVRYRQSSAHKGGGFKYWRDDAATAAVVRGEGKTCNQYKTINTNRSIYINKSTSIHLSSTQVLVTHCLHAHSLPSHTLPTISRIFP